MQKRGMIACLAVVACACPVARGSEEPAEPPSDEQLAAWVADLRDDDIQWNAAQAEHLLLKAGVVAIRHLEGALSSDDYQQRQFAAGVLRRQKEYEPSDLMLRVCVEGLADDTLPMKRSDPGRDNGSYNNFYNASRGIEYLVPHVERAERFLIAAIIGPRDEQQRLLAAFVLGAGGRGGTAPLVAEVLIPHLRDNDLEEDAKYACYGLYHLGESVVPFLQAALDGADAQQRELLTLIIDDLLNPPDREQTFQNKQRQNITSVVCDPAVEEWYQGFYGFDPRRW
ncbi:MAG: hypothetical protein KDA16_07650 [Phycisphaerales bacterium]|nr:hypothetical protein [Phycisphaerales bacterium]